MNTPWGSGSWGQRSWGESGQIIAEPPIPPPVSVTTEPILVIAVELDTDRPN